MSSSEVLVTVIMPVFNGERFLSEAIQSILAQTELRFELILVDDGSRDGSADICRTFASKDSRIVVIRQENLGPAAASNRALQAASSDLVVRMDADDVMLPNRIERQISFMRQHPSLSVATSYSYLTDGNGRVIAKSEPIIDFETGRAQRDPRHFVELNHPACIMRKADVLAVGGYDPSYRFGDDRHLWGRLVTQGYQLGVQQEYLLKQRLHEGSLTLNDMRRNELICRYIDENILLRLEGLAEVPYNTFIAARHSDSYLGRMKGLTTDYASIFYKKATRDYAQRRWFRLAGHAAMAMLLQPDCAIRMIRKRRVRVLPAEARVG